MAITQLRYIIRPLGHYLGKDFDRARRVMNLLEPCECPEIRPMHTKHLKQLVFTIWLYLV